jgi:excisionase family DNA binding protein
VGSSNQEKPLAVSVVRAKALTGLGHSTIYRLINDGTLETSRVGKRRLINFASIERLIAPGAQTDTPTKDLYSTRRAKAKAG